MPMRALIRGMALALVSVGAFGCAGADTARPLPMAVGLKLPFVAQAGPHLCGVACMEMLTRCYGRPLGAMALRDLKAEAEATGGVSGASMKSALESAGYGVVVYPGTLDRGPAGLFRQVDLGLPVLVMTGAGPRHYCLVDGYDEGRSVIRLLDPAQGKVDMPFARFEAAWNLAGHFALLAAPLHG
jgi:ABC-type bacteriocin/lantibiotic exporter with double-glycine peptidase domain